jgi:hypothetical protein
VRAADCLIVGRTPAAYATHPQALIDTEAIANRTVAHLLGLPQPIDLSAGSKGFSHRAAALLVTHARPDQPMGADAEWPVLLHRFGLTINYTEVDGLDWETADRSRPSAATRADQQALADALDADPQQWAARVAIAREIIEAGLEASQRALGPG